MRILIADDDATSREILAAVLRKQGHEIAMAEDGEQAWTAYQDDETLRLLLVDWRMPELDGISLCRRIRAEESERRPYFIVITTMGLREHVVEGLDAGADDYIVKPFAPLELRARVDVGIRMLQLQDRLAAQRHALEDALANVQTLRGLIPICAKCKRIRDDRDFWHEVEHYVAKHTNALFSHGLCPSCIAELYPGLDLAPKGSS